ncbi:pre-mRNA-splicing regulator WTAP [Engraulis encrasicolus]|uniref:pre-mRNA-splicing regulator WTAP n=1 Tax=Engraulis encrasicolus TaxID=184585 RepID=UPI002FD17611
MTNEEPLPKKVRLSESDLKTLNREELCARWKQHEAYVQVLEAKYADLNSNDVTGLKESEEKLKQQQQESARRENILVMRLATKEQEMQECTTQIQYLKQVQQPSAAQLRSSMVDPAINLIFLKMKAELEQTKDKLEQAQNELSAWKFTPDSQTGKKLMSKCRMLIQENQELGRQLSQGRIAQLEAELALQKKYSEELKSSQDELNDFIIQLDEEVEGMQSTILTLQQQLKETRQQLSQQPQGQSSATATTGGPSRTAPPSPSTSSDPGSQTELASGGGGKDCGRVSNGPANGSGGGGGQRGGASSGAAALYREGGSSSVDEDFPPSPSAMSSPPPGECSKLSNHSEEAASAGSGSGAGQVAGGDRLERQLSVGYESVDSPTGSEASAALHSNDTDSNADTHEAPAAVAKGSRTAGPRHAAASSSASAAAAHNGLDSMATAATAAGSATPTTTTSCSSTGSVL